MVVIKVLPTRTLLILFGIAFLIFRILLKFAAPFHDGADYHRLVFAVHRTYSMPLTILIATDVSHQLVIVVHLIVVILYWPDSRQEDISKWS